MITVEALSVVYETPAESVIALQDVSFTALAGTATAVVGTSGSGKSTLLRAIAGLVRAASGSVVVGGVSMTAADPEVRAARRLKAVGYVTQDANLLPGLTVVENVALPAELCGAARKAARQLALEYLDRLGIANLAQRFPSQLSGGQRHRVAVARGLVGDRRVLLVDEPTAALDAAASECVLEALEVAQSLGATIVVATHDPLVTERVNRCVELRHGTLERG